MATYFITRKVTEESALIIPAELKRMKKERNEKNTEREKEKYIN
jgi:hypothetical protein